MKATFRKSMIWLHTYLGVILGWLLFAIFFTGTLSYFTPEITRYLMPERASISKSQQTMIAHSFAYLGEHASEAEQWRIALPSERSALWSVQWREGKQRQTVVFNNQLASVENETDTKGGLFFRNFHYTLQLRGYGGRYIAGVAAMAMLLAIFTGIYTHRRFFKDFFTLRPQKLKKWTTDFHALAGILTIPFCIMICLSGIFIYAIMYLPYTANANFERGERGVNSQIIPSLPSLHLNEKIIGNDHLLKASTLPPKHNYAHILEQIANQWREPNPIARITVEGVGYKNSRMIVERSKATTVSNRAERLVFETYTGKPLKGYDDETVPAQIRRILYGLHQANFAPIGMRWLLFGLGILGCALIATGNIIWVTQRKKSAKQNPFTLALVEKGNVAAVAGLILASVSFFIANKLIGHDVEGRAQLEVNTFFTVWALSAVHAFWRTKAAVAWKEQFALASGLCFVTVAIELVSFRDRIANSIEYLDSVYLSFIPAFFVSGIILHWAAKKIGLRITNADIAKISTKSGTRVKKEQE
ncbi:PepSY domain-containing protein [Alteromonas sp. BL110]|uniref:PepSY-associated TM helix domain-containing protein n=1 Tax=Alteromonas sp. BL110 TaxID=1714845 RepID=UPI000E49C242|nr:PepSY-associated TM helix domain-containing protein [Alteromonas sp. BL110]AXT40556.1 PepSY domain-containing protein [Alteromonas sp. BL110]RKM79792.1 PepSY domain-containing protein [Alteromonas sp. BL110]